MSKIEDFQKTINVQFKNLDLLEQVFVHRSYLNENPGFKLDHNERLEFLGDAVLELVTTEYLYSNFPNPEGELTNWRSALVKGERISQVAAELGLNDYLYLSKGEAQSIGKSRQLILANTFEALIGAIFLDQGYASAQDFITKNLLKYTNEIIEKKLYRDAKSSLQEISQDKYSITPNYSLISESGPDHDKIFVIGVNIGENLVGQGKGSSKQEAEQDAAKNALEKIDLA
jgi:ribonuclease-3